VGFIDVTACKLQAIWARCITFALVRIASLAAAIISLWRRRHPISVGMHTALVMPVQPTVAAASSRRVDSGSCQTLLVLQFVIKFAYIWAQYWPSTYVSTHVGFLICALMSKWQPFIVGNRRNFPYFFIWHREYGRQGPKKAYTGLRSGIYLPTKFGCDWSIVVALGRGMTDVQTSHMGMMRHVCSGKNSSLGCCYN